MAAPRRIGYALKTVSHLVKLRIDQTIAAGETRGVTGMQGWIIGYLYRHRDERDFFQHDLELEFNISRPTATGLLQRMERDGLIVREPVSSDARRKKITLTPTAAGIHENVMRAIDKVEQSITEGLSAQEIDAFFSILEKIQKNIEAPQSASGM